jgi:sugar lactone lactonase YvrE
MKLYRLLLVVAVWPLLAFGQDSHPVLVETLAKDLPGGTGGMEVDSAGFVYSSDFGSKLGGGGTGGDKIFKLDPETGASTIFASGLQGASGSAIGPNGDFFQSNVRGNLISRITPEGVVSVFLDHGLESPVGIAIDDEGSLFVANCGANSIARVTPEGASSVFVADPLLQCPNGITMDLEHNFYVANFGNGDVVKISRAGEVSKLATLPGENNGHLTHQDGFLYVVARGVHQLYRVSLTGDVELFAGSGERGHDDGPALEATFSYPNDLAFSPDGKMLYVNENGPTTEPHTVLAPKFVRRIRIGE